MASRGRNPVRSFRLGAVVLLAMAGTAATLVVSEWPLIGQSIAGKASQSQVAATGHGTVRAVPASVRGLFMPDEPDPYAALPEMMTTGSAAESRRIARLQQESSPPLQRLRGCITGGGELGYGPPELYDYIEWQQHTPLGRVVEHVIASHADRSNGSSGLNPKIAPQLREFSFTGDDPEQTTPGAVHDALNLGDLTVRLDRLSMPPINDAADFDVSAVLRAAERPDDRYRRPVVMDAAAGNDATLRVGKNSMIRASANGEAPGVIRDYVNLQLEQVWNLGGGSSFSVGWRHQRGVMSNELPEPTVRQDALLLELKFGF
ncbi:MAG: hypothetical protein QM783_05935 [Phycisphaerales bacterium]